MTSILLQWFVSNNCQGKNLVKNAFGNPHWLTESMININIWGTNTPTPYGEEFVQHYKLLIAIIFDELGDLIF